MWHKEQQTLISLRGNHMMAWWPNVKFVVLFNAEEFEVRELFGLVVTHQVKCDKSSDLLTVNCRYNVGTNFCGIPVPWATVCIEMYLHDCEHASKDLQRKYGKYYTIMHKEYFNRVFSYIMDLTYDTGGLERKPHRWLYSWTLSCHHCQEQFVFLKVRVTVHHEVVARKCLMSCATLNFCLCTCRPPSLLWSSRRCRVAHKSQLPKALGCHMVFKHRKTNVLGLRLKFTRQTSSGQTYWRACQLESTLFVLCTHERSFIILTYTASTNYYCMSDRNVLLILPQSSGQFKPDLFWWDSIPKTLGLLLWHTAFWMGKSKKIK